MRAHTISVTVGTDSIQVAPETLTMTSEDEVQWAGTNGRAFSIEFEGATPFDQGRLAHAHATTRRRPRSKGRFKYTVVSDENSGVRLDPVIVIEEPPTGRP